MVKPYRSDFFAFPIGLDGLYSIDQVLYESAPGNLGVSSDGALDVAVVALKPETKEPPSFTILRTVSALPLAQDESRAYVVGHPMGSILQISLNDSLLQDIEDAERLMTTAPHRLRQFGHSGNADFSFRCSGNRPVARAGSDRRYPRFPRPSLLFGAF